MAKIRKINDKFIVDYRLRGERHRPEFKTRSEALEFMKSVVRLKFLGESTESGKIEDVLVEEAAENYLETVSKKKGAATYETEKTYFQKLTDFFPETLVSSIRLLDLQRFENHLKAGSVALLAKDGKWIVTFYNRKGTKRVEFAKKWEAENYQKEIQGQTKPLANSTINRHFNTYRNFFGYCKKWNYIKDNPCENLTKLKESKYRPRIWTPEEKNLVFAVVPQWAKDCFWFASKTGLRQQEIISVKRTDYDPRNKTLTVGSWKGGGDENLRIIPLLPDVDAFVKEKLISHSAKTILVNEKGQPIRNKHLCSIMHRAVKKVNLKGFTLHGLRHTLFTEMGRNNVGIRKIQVLAGHANISTTQRYTQVDTEDIRDELKLIDNVIEFGKDGQQWAVNEKAPTRNRG